MSETSPARVSLSEDFTRLVNALPAVMQKPRDDPMFIAWCQWRDVLVGQLRLLEMRERELSSEPYLWITEAVGDPVPAGHNRTEG